MVSDDTRSRFLSKALPVESGCHEWQSTMHRDGYGKFWLGRGQVAAHRASWIIQNGEIPDGLWVLHKCDNRKCVRLDHLYIGTPKDNVRDRNERAPTFGRMKTPFEKVQKARALYADGLSQQAIGRTLGICQTSISRYVRFEQRATR